MKRDETRLIVGALLGRSMKFDQIVSDHGDRWHRGWVLERGRPPTSATVAPVLRTKARRK